MKGQVLLIDDNPIDIKVVGSTLEHSGYAYHGFTDYKDGIAWLDSHIPQLIFLDLQMPEITGFDLISLCRGHVHAKLCPIIIISSKKQMEDVKKAIQLGADDYIIKPVDPMVLQQKINKIEAGHEDEFFRVNLPLEQAPTAFFCRSFQVVSFSEFGFKAESDYPVKSGETIEVSGMPDDLFGASKIMVRCLSSERRQDTHRYVMQFTFVGIPESQRQFIRKACRQAWVQLKNA